MKTILFSFLFFAFTALNAQYVITATANPVPGDVVSAVDLNINNITIPTGGTNKLWNYTSINYTSSSVSSETYVALSTVPNHSLFPGATIAITDGYEYGVFKINSSTIDQLGNASSTSSDCSVFTDPATFLTLPFLYGSGYYDTYNYPDHSQTVSGNITACGCGSGTLALPGFTINNVLMVSLTLHETNSISSYSATGVFYRFYSSLSKFPLLSIETTTTIQSSITNTFVNVSVNKAFALGVGIEERTVENVYTIYPNPVSNETVFIHFDNKESSELNLKLFNTLGQLIKEENYTNLPLGENKLAMDLKNIPPGIYSLQIKTGGTESVRKLIIE